MKKSIIFSTFISTNVTYYGRCSWWICIFRLKSEIGNDLYQDITKINNDVYVLSKKAIYKFDSNGKKTEIPLELCDMGSFSGTSVICYNYSDSSFR